MKILRLSILLPLIISAIFALPPIKVIDRAQNRKDVLKVLKNTTVSYCSIKDLARVLSTKVYESLEREKLVLYLGEHRIKVSAGTSFLVVNDEVFQMTSPAIKRGDDIYVPAKGLFPTLQKSVLPEITYDPQQNKLELAKSKYSVSAIAMEEKANGTIIRIKTEKRFKKRDISTFLHKNGWFYCTINGGTVDPAVAQAINAHGAIKKISIDQLGNSAQIAFLLRTDIERHEFYRSKDPDEIVVTLWVPLSNSAARINEVKKQWELDTVVLDAGHGGKDSGAHGKYGTKEKDIVLDVVKRTGRLLQKNTNIKVVYTRDEDVFIPLWKRTQIANESNGKIFISVHTNGNNSRRPSGFETYLLRPGKTKDAIDVAAQENAVIQMEENRKNKYESFTSEGIILATMAQSMFMKESEDLAAFIQTELDKHIQSPNRGVKQAGFVVLIGASMPNVLVEIGFITNPTEEKNLRNSKYRQRIAESIFRAVVEFKKSREYVLAEG